MSFVCRLGEDVWNVEKLGEMVSWVCGCNKNWRINGKNLYGVSGFKYLLAVLVISAR